MKWYFGKIAIGTPYFFPRKTVKSKTKPGYMEFKNVKWLWLTVTSLGWKSKWDDLRFEWNPGISLVILNRQLNVTFVPGIPDHCLIDSYWEAWLYYDQRTDKSKSKEERLIELFNQWSCTWIRYKKDERVETDYFPLILKKKYLEIYLTWLKNKNDA
jgi:hypothetical protein